MKERKENLNLLISIDDNYLTHAMDLIYSIMINNNINLELYLIYGDNLSKGSLKLLEKFLQENNYGSLHKIYFNNKENKLPMYIDYISITTYFRLFAPYLIRENIDRILYLDCDIVCNGDIVEFYKTDFEGNTIIGCKNILAKKYEEWGPKINIRIGLPEDYNYINAGVLLINLQSFKKTISAEKILKFIEKNAENLAYQDQDVINCLFHNKIKLANIIYNFQINPIDSKKDYKNARLIHYSEQLKPWDIKYNNPSKAIFYYELLIKQNRLKELKTLINKQYKNMAINLYNSIIKDKIKE